MSLLAAGVPHRSTPIAVPERAACGQAAWRALSRENIAEALPLTTCKRVEVYALVESFHGGSAEATSILARHSKIVLDQPSGLSCMRATRS